MSDEFIAASREIRRVTIPPPEPALCDNCGRRRVEHERGWQRRERTEDVVQDAVILRRATQYYLCRECASRDPRKPVWQRLVRALYPDSGPPKSF